MNLVLGWTPGSAGFGVELKGHDARFEVGEEWMEIFDRLWEGKES